MRRLAITFVGAALLAGGCGQPSVPRTISRDLQARVATIRAALEDDRIFGARQQLGRLTSEVHRLMETGRIEAGAGIDILDAAAAVTAALGPAASAPSTPPGTISPSPTEEQGGNAYGKDKDKGNGDEGHGNDD